MRPADTFLVRSEAARGGKCVRFPIGSVRVFRSRSSEGVRGMDLAEGDRLVLAVAVNIGKDPMFEVGDRVEMVEAEARALTAGDRVNGCVLEVRAFDNLLVDFAQNVGARLVIRGLRAISDFEYEFQMAATNARLCLKIETVFLPASETNQFISSRFVKEIARLGGDVSSFVSEDVRARLDALPRG